MTDDKLTQASALRRNIAGLETALVEAEKISVWNGEHSSFVTYGLSPKALVAVRRIVMDDLQDQLAEKRAQFEAL